MTNLAQLKDTSRPRKTVRRVGRGVGSKRGKTAGRGGKGDSARQGYRKRFGYEGGQVPLYRKLPVRGFTRGRFVKPLAVVSLETLEKYYADKEVVNFATLRSKGLISRKALGGVKILSDGELTKKVTIEAKCISKAAMKKLEANAIPYKIVA